VLLEVLLGGGDELDGCELEAAVLEAGDDGADKTALGRVSSVSKAKPRSLNDVGDAVGLRSNWLT
jgi:hypothetical protein